jgi:hypothetical protein
MKKTLHWFIIMLVYPLGLSACASAALPPAPPTLTVIVSSVETPSSLEEPAPKGIFELSVLVDLDSESVTREQAQAVVDEASQILFRLTEFVFEMVDFREYSGGFKNNNLLNEYLSDLTAVPSDGIVIFSFGDRGLAKQYGGYSFSFPGLAGFTNQFVSEYYEPNNVYVGIIHYGLHYAPCGYGDSETPVSDVSVGEECFEQVGTACVEKFGYSTCGNAVDTVYASTPTYATAAEIVHQLMHAFGPSGDAHHYGTKGCTDEMSGGISLRPYNFNSLPSEGADSYLGLCPFVYDNFMKSYQP